MKVFDGAKMRAIRKEAELTQYDLAPMVGISQNRVSDIERNVTTPTIEEIKDTKVKEQILAAVSKVVEELGGN